MALFAGAYWAPVSYYRLAVQAPLVQIEQHEHYQKQSYRNRCLILSANGPLALTVPVLRPHHVPIKEIRIDNSMPWRQKHLRAMEAAYRSSAYFEEFYGDVYALYKNETVFLFDLNLRSWEIALKLLEFSLPWELSAAFEPVTNQPWEYRYLIHPKKKPITEWLQPEGYFQVFAHKFGYNPDLSILDLLFNHGRLEP